MAHKIGGEFHVPHGRANAILLPFTIRYNGTKPQKLSTWPKYNYYKADEKYAELARILGLPASTIEEGVESYAKACGVKLNSSPIWLMRISALQPTLVFQW